MRIDPQPLAFAVTLYASAPRLASLILNIKIFYNTNIIFIICTGESNVYTLGTIGSHRVVATKLPSVGRTREAMTAAGNTTTRLLGIFQKVNNNIYIKSNFQTII